MTATGPPARPPAPDPFAALEGAARRQLAEEAAGRAVAAARCRLVLGADPRSAFFAALALRLAPRADWATATLATDGRSLAYRPDFVTGLSAAELDGVLAHEVLHFALGHHARRAGRNARRWNVACDLAVNPVLLGAGFALPAGRLVPGEGEFAHLQAGRPAEEYYRLLADEGGESGGPGGPGDGGPEGSDPGGCGAVRDPADGSQAEASAAEWAVAVAQAEQAVRRRGELPSGLARPVAAALAPRVDWRAALAAFLARQARDDYRWMPPNRRFVARGLYLPGLRSEGLGEMVLAVDTSGSIGGRELDRFAAEAAGLLEAYECDLSVLYHDTTIQGVEQWRPGDGPLRLRPVGGGGTSHRCVFEWAEREAPDAAAVVCLTDLETEFPDRPPAIPILWAVIGGVRIQPPFGLRVSVNL